MSDGTHARAHSQIAGPLEGRFFRALLWIVVLGGLAWGAAFAWRTWGVPATRGPEYLITAEKIIATPTPEWIRSDVVQEVFDSGSLENQSILDSQLTIKVADAFRLHPWVRTVRRVSKSRPAKVEVDLEYRRPAALVEVTTAEARGVLPIDGDGVLLPRDDFVDEQGELIPQALKYPVIAGGDSIPQGSSGAAWGDPSIHAAGRIAATMGETWLKCGLFKIAPASPEDGGSPEGEFVLLAKSGSRVLWGPSPGETAKDLALAKSKIEKLLEYVERNEPLDRGSSPVEVDLRDAADVRIVPRTAVRRDADHDASGR